MKSSLLHWKCLKLFLKDKKQKNYWLLLIQAIQFGSSPIIIIKEQRPPQIENLQFWSKMADLRDHSIVQPWAFHQRPFLLQRKLGVDESLVIFDFTVVTNTSDVFFDPPSIFLIRPPSLIFCWIEHFVVHKNYNINACLRKGVLSANIEVTWNLFLVMRYWNPEENDLKISVENS